MGVAMRDGIRYGASDSIELTKAEYDALVKNNEIEPDVNYFVTDEEEVIEIDSVKLHNDQGAIRFGIDENGNWGYFKDGADTVTPFKSGEGGETLFGGVSLENFTNTFKESNGMTYEYDSLGQIMVHHIGGTGIGIVFSLRVDLTDLKSITLLYDATTYYGPNYPLTFRIAKDKFPAATVKTITDDHTSGTNKTLTLDVSEFEGCYTVEFHPSGMNAVFKEITFEGSPMGAGNYRFIINKEMPVGATENEYFSVDANGLLTFKKSLQNVDFNIEWRHLKTYVYSKPECNLSSAYTTYSDFAWQLFSTYLQVFRFKAELVKKGDTISLPDFGILFNCSLLYDKELKYADWIHLGYFDVGETLSIPIPEDYNGMLYFSMRYDANTFCGQIYFQNGEVNYASRTTYDSQGKIMISPWNGPISSIAFSFANHTLKRTMDSHSSGNFYYAYTHDKNIRPLLIDGELVESKPYSYGSLSKGFYVDGEWIPAVDYFKVLSEGTMKADISEEAINLTWGGASNIGVNICGKYPIPKEVKKIKYRVEMGNRSYSTTNIRWRAYIGCIPSVATNYDPYYSACHSYNTRSVVIEEEINIEHIYDDRYFSLNAPGWDLKITNLEFLS